MHVIFLDVDGVLNTTHSSMWTISKKKLKLLRRLVETTGAEIVVSSTWRVPRWTAIDNKQPLDVLRKKLFYSKMKIFDKTPIIYDKGCAVDRGIEIDQWLKDHPEVTNYVILDDCDEFTKEQKSHLVLTNPDNGLTEIDVILAIFILSQDKEDVENGPSNVPVKAEEDTK